MEYYDEVFWNTTHYPHLKDVDECVRSCIYNAFKREGLELDGFSDLHDEVLKRMLG